MEGHVSAPILGTPAWYAQREIELLARLATQPQAVVQLLLRKVRIQSIANAQRYAGKQAMGSQTAAPQVAGGEARPKTAAQIERRRRSDRKLREKHLARKAWAAVRVGLALRRWWHRASRVREAACNCILFFDSGACPASSSTATPAARPCPAARPGAANRGEQCVRPGAGRPAARWLVERPQRRAHAAPLCPGLADRAGGAQARSLPNSNNTHLPTAGYLGRVVLLSRAGD